jgi:hypothetical protein
VRLDVGSERGAVAERVLGVDRGGHTGHKSTSAAPSNPLAVASGVGTFQAAIRPPGGRIAPGNGWVAWAGTRPSPGRNG